ncbi:hypothetical protein [Amycolatopsis decaplanina]|uniref:hypothetical protein n=1 Tax=Amycolatopsis decaplanina TaxID=208441 RepID=UPI0003487E9E|nr:hypothetical protein [Amycolatopsis decaplanina]
MKGSFTDSADDQTCSGPGDTGGSERERRVPLGDDLGGVGIAPASTPSRGTFA